MNRYDLALRGLSFIRRIENRSKLLDRILGVRYNDASMAAIDTSCAISKMNIGHYYSWRVEQYLVTRLAKNMTRHNTSHWLSQLDHSNYGQLDDALKGDQGVLLAMPHYGHFVLSVVGALNHLIGKRRVLVFYDSPEMNHGNATFDAMHQRLFGHADSGVEIVHNNRQGIATALKALRQRAVVIIMPDVYHNVLETHQLPIMGYTRNVMLGTSVLAKRSNAKILPVLSYPIKNGLGFTTLMGSVVASTNAFASDFLNHYATTVKIFSQFEQLMCSCTIYWQYSADHFVAGNTFPIIEEDAICETANLFLSDPRISINSASFIPV